MMEFLIFKILLYFMNFVFKFQIFYNESMFILSQNYLCYKEKKSKLQRTNWWLQGKGKWVL